MSLRGKKIFNMRFRIDLRIFIFLILFYVTNQIQIYVLIMCFAIIHELGHLLAGLVLGFKPNKIEMNPFGLSISFKFNLKDYNKRIKKAKLIEEKKIFVAMAGPIVNLLIILIINGLLIVVTNLKIMVQFGYQGLIIIFFL